MQNTTNSPIRAGCYCRISSDPDDKREGVDRQREDTALLCELKGWDIVDVYIDNDRSASNGKDRPQWQRLLGDIRSGKIDAVAAWDQDRVNRTMDDFMAYKPLFVERGTLLATSNNGEIDLSTPSGVLTAGIKTLVSEHEISMMKLRMRRAAQQAAQRGTPKWRADYAFGFTSEHQPDCAPDCTSAYHVHPTEGPLVAQAYADILAGASLTGIANQWSAAGHIGRGTKNRPGKPWKPSTFSLFIRAARNAGLRSHNDVIVYDDDGHAVKGAWPALVSEQTWRDVQKFLDRPERHRPGPKTVRRHLLTGIIRCGKCPDGVGKMGGYLAPTGAERYRCWKCRGVAIDKPHTEQFILRLVCERLAREDARQLLIDPDAPDLDALAAEANRLRARKLALAADHAKGIYDAEEWQVMRAVIGDDIDAVEKKMQCANRARVFAGLPLGTDKVTEAFLSMDTDRQRAVISAIMSPVIRPVGKGHRPAVGADGVRFDSDRIIPNWRQ